MISTCIITHRIDENLGRAMKSVAGLGQTVVVDTKGAPPAINFQGYYTYPWADNFAAARNFALEKARGKYILSLDSDEWIDESGRDFLFWLSRQPADRAYYSRLLENGRYIMDQVKIFPNRSDIRYYGRIHEQIIPAIKKLGMPIEPPFEPPYINIYHDGYADPETLKGKRQRNLRISHNWLRDEPDNPWANYWHGYIRR